MHIIRATGRYLLVVVELLHAGGVLEVVDDDQAVQALVVGMRCVVFLQTVAQGLDELLVGPCDLVDHDDEHIGQVEDEVLEEVLGGLLAHDGLLHQPVLLGLLVGLHQLQPVIHLLEVVLVDGMTLFPPALHMLAHGQTCLFFF